jgi:hypothetical protein
VAKATPTRFDFAKQSAPSQSPPIGFIAHVICCWFMLTLYAVGLRSTVCGGGLRRREKPDPGARPDPAGLPPKRGKCATLTHDYKGHGTTTLFAALSVLDGKVIGRCVARHRHQEFIRFIATVERSVPTGKVSWLNAVEGFFSRLTRQKPQTGRLSLG